MAKAQRTKETWLAAGFKSLAEQGPQALKINLLAQNLGATKGSFYWHFRDLPEYKTTMLQLWQTKGASEVIAKVTAENTPESQLNSFFENASRAAPDDYGGQKIETAMRAWALADAEVATALAEVDKLRLGFLTTLLDAQGLDGSKLSALVYGAYIGLEDLQSKGHTPATAGLSALKPMIESLKSASAPARNIPGPSNPLV